MCAHSWVPSGVSCHLTTYLTTYGPWASHLEHSRC
jgi:hypothetical protein